MHMTPMTYEQPKSTSEAVALMQECGNKAKVLGGGTDLIVDLKHKPGIVSVLVDITKIPELQGIEETSEGLRIGSAVTYTSIMKSPVCQKLIPAVCEASHTVGAVQTRSLGTIGGNLVTCVPSADSAPSLMVLESVVTIAGKDGERTLPIEEFFVGPRKTCLEPHEILVSILIPKKNLGKPSFFLKAGLRKGQALSLVNVASALNIVDGKISNPCIALGAVAPTPIRVPEAESFLKGKEASDENLKKASEMAVASAKPITDFRASLAYRNQLVKVMTYRTLKSCVDNQ
jgi:carbon-monoxide dehydrogenase medium subunit